MAGRGIGVLAHDQDANCGAIGVENAQNIGTVWSDGLTVRTSPVQLGEDALEQVAVAVNQRTPRGVNPAGEFVEILA